MITGDTHFPKSKPNLNHSKFRGFKYLGISKVIIKKKKLIVRKIKFIPLLKKNGRKDIIKKNIEKNYPKVFF